MTDKYNRDKCRVGFMSFTLKKNTRDHKGLLAEGKPGKKYVSDLSVSCAYRTLTLVLLRIGTGDEGRRRRGRGYNRAAIINPDAINQGR